MEQKWNVYSFKTDIRVFLINDFIFLIRILSTRIYTLYRDILFSLTPSYFSIIQFISSFPFKPGPYERWP